VATEQRAAVAVGDQLAALGYVKIETFRHRLKLTFVAGASALLDGVGHGRPVSP
jgi:hypothetical protein